MIQLVLQLLMLLFNLGEPAQENDLLVKDYIKSNEILSEHCIIALNEC
ncbi:hypothetical protein [uncultured Salegentibacter sp.]